MTEPRPSLSPWTPLQHSVFRAIWLATVVSNLGTWIQNVGAAWLMTSLSPSALMVALIQTATSLPMFLLSLPAGALADVINRRKLLLFTQTWMLAWLAILSTFNVAAIISAPEWVKSRALGVYMLIFNGGLALGRRVRKGSQNVAGGTVARRRARLAFAGGRFQSHASRRVFHGRVMAGTFAPARASHAGRQGTPGSGEFVPHGCRTPTRVTFPFS